MSAIAHRLASPARHLPLAALGDTWVQATISARIAGHGVLARDLALLRRIRGGIGDILLESASADAIAGRPCPWDPPCALDILFREQGRKGQHGIPKPYVLAAERSGRDLTVRMTLFGFAVDWAAAATHALVATLQHRIAWRAQRPDLFLPKHAVTDVSLTSSEGLRLPPPRDAAEIEFLTPMNAEGDDPVERPATLFVRLARRIAGLALWHDIAVEEDWPRLAAAWDAVRYDLGFLRRGERARHSGRLGKSFSVETVTGVLRMTDLAPELWPLLALGQETHVGKGASEGFGRFALHR